MYHSPGLPIGYPGFGGATCDGWPRRATAARANRTTPSLQFEILSTAATYNDLHRGNAFSGTEAASPCDMDTSHWAATVEQLRVLLWIITVIVYGYVVSQARRASGAPPQPCPICGRQNDPLCVGLLNAAQTFVAPQTAESAARVPA